MKIVTEESIDKYLAEVVKLIEEDDSFSLRVMSNKLVEESAFTDNKALFELALIAYAFSKLLRKQHFRELPGWDSFKKSMAYYLKKEIQKESTLESMQETLSQVLERIREFDEQAGNYAVDVVHHARVKQASRMYALGLSLSRACEIAGVSKAELIDYVGTTKIHERPFTQTKSVRERWFMTRKVLE